MKNFSKIISLILLFSICTWYLLVIYWTLYPRVNNEYKLHYITKDLVDWPGYNGLNYSIGEKLFFGTDENGLNKVRHRGIGWSSKENWGCWTDGSKSSLYFTFKKNLIPSEMIIKANSFYPPGYLTVKIYCNKEYITTLKMKHSEIKEYSFLIPEDIIKIDTPNLFEFEIEDPKSPFEYRLSEDKRSIGMGVLWIELK